MTNSAIHVHEKHTNSLQPRKSGASTLPLRQQRGMRLFLKATHRKKNVKKFMDQYLTDEDESEDMEGKDH